MSPPCFGSSPPRNMTSTMPVFSVSCPSSVCNSFGMLSYALWSLCLSTTLWLSTSNTQTFACNSSWGITSVPVLLSFPALQEDSLACQMYPPSFASSGILASLHCFPQTSLCWSLSQMSVGLWLWLWLSGVSGPGSLFIWDPPAPSPHLKKA